MRGKIETDTFHSIQHTSFQFNSLLNPTSTIVINYGNAAPAHVLYKYK